jgi:hypothetical protein
MVYADIHMKPPRTPSTQRIADELNSTALFGLVAGAISGEWDPREAYPFIDHVMAEDDVLDPCLDNYQ